MQSNERHALSTHNALAELEVAVASEKGLRDENQDCLSWTQNPRGELFVVADGMGGHKGGARASRMTVDAVEKFLAEAPPEWPFARALGEAIRRANEEVHRAAHSGDPETQNMGSTVLVALVSDGKAYIGHVGDSRAYLYRRGKLRRLTRDHTRLQQMLDARMLTPKQARNYPDGHVLSRAIGSRPEVEVEIAQPLTLKEGDALLLCSDGLSGFVNDEQIRTTLAKQPDVQRVPGDLVNLALAAGGNDNVTVQFVRVGKRVRERVIGGLPVPPAPWAAGHVHGALTDMARRPSAWALASIGIALGVAAFLASSRPVIEFTYEPEPTGAGRDVWLHWTSRHAETVIITPDIGRDRLPLEGSARVRRPVNGPTTYTATATGTTLMLWSRRSEEILTISPDEMSEGQPSSTGTSTTSDAPARSSTPTVTETSPSTGRATPSDRLTPAATPPAATEPPLSAVSTPADRTGEAVPADEPPQTPFDEPTPSPPNAPAPTDEPVAPEKDLDVTPLDCRNTHLQLHIRPGTRQEGRGFI